VLGSTERKRVGYEDRYPFVHQAFVGRPSYRRLGRPSDMMPQEGIPTTYKGRKEGKTNSCFRSQSVRGGGSGPLSFTSINPIAQLDKRY